MIIDTTMFNKDFTTLGIRLAELYDVVDLFVICESKYTFSGQQKKLYLTENINLFKQFANKIEIVVEDKKHFTKIAMIREIHQRKRISQYLNQIKFDARDLILYSDCDEIPRAEIVASLSNQQNVNALLELRGFSNYINTESGVWPRARIVSGNNYKSIESLRQDIFLYNLENRKKLKKFFVRVPYYWTTRNFYLWQIPIKYVRPNLSILRNAGWHFNNLFLPEEIYWKIESSAHTEFNTETIKKNAINNYLSGRDIYFGHKYLKVDIDKTFPKEIQENLEKYKKYILV